MKLVDIYSLTGPFLRPLGLPYSFFMGQRRSMYQKGLINSYEAACPVISVGNISWGGTGKTPVVAWFLQWAEDNGLKAVVLSRGYKGKPGKRPLLVRRDTPVGQSGDEPLLLARAFSKASVVVFPQRVQAARFAENYLAPDLIILDDGMQHLSIKRDLEIVLLRPEDLTHEWGRVIPSGSWREGASALASASVFCVKTDCAEFESLAPAARKRLASFGKPLFGFSMQPIGLRPVFPRLGKIHPLLEPEEYVKRPYLLLSGVGNPGQVERTATELMGRSPAGHYIFDDHHPFTETDVQGLISMNTGQLPLVCTSKDAVKLKSYDSCFGRIPLWTMETRVEFGPCLDFSAAGEARRNFSAWWGKWWENRPGTSGSKGLR